MDQQAEKDRKSNRTRQKNKKGDSKVESNDSPEIPDRGETSDIPCFPSGAAWEREDLEYQFWLPGYNAKVTEASKDKLCVVIRCMNSHACAKCF